MRYLKSFKFVSVFVIFLTTVILTSQPSFSQTSHSRQDHLQALTERWVAQSSENAKAIDKAKKDVEKFEENFKKHADKAFQDSFNSVFGKDKLKPSAAIDYLKVFEAVGAGDIEEAGKLSTDLLISAYAPGLGQYIKAAKFVHEKIDKQITSWGDEVYKTETFIFFRRDLAHMSKLDAMEAHNLNYPAYVPSYMVQKFRKDPYIGKDMTTLYDEMVKFENRLFRQWSEGDEPREFALQFGDLKKKSWWDFGSTGGKNSQWIVALGADPSAFGNLSVERKMFNFFLYELTSSPSVREDYMLNLSVYYIEPLMKLEARKEEKRLDAAIAKAMSSALANLNKETEKFKSEKQTASADADAKPLETKYRKYLDDGLADQSLRLPMGMTADAAYQIGMKAVEYKKGYYEAIDNLNALARKQAMERKRDEKARHDVAKRIAAEEQTEAGKLAPEITDVAESFTNTNEVVKQGAASVTSQGPTQSHISPNLRRCLANYDFSKHENADMLVLLPEYLEADAQGYLNDDDGQEKIAVLVRLAGDVCNQKATGEDEADTRGETDDWGDADDIDDLLVSDLSENEKWQLRDELASQSKRDAQRSEERMGRQYASVEAKREEEARIKAEKAAKRAAFLAELSAGLNEVAAQIQETNRQDANTVDRNRQPSSTASAKSNHIDTSACERRLMGNKDFPVRDVHLAKMMCQEEATAQVSNSNSSSNSYSERLKQQQQETAIRRTNEANALREESENRRENTAMRDRAKVQCGCYRKGRSDGAKHTDPNYQVQTTRPEHCLRSRGMGNTQPWRRGYFDGKQNKVQRPQDVQRWCRFGD